MSFFNPSDSFWAGPLPLPDAHLVATRFDHRPLSKQDFLRHGINLPASLQCAAPKRRAEFLAGRLCAHRALVQMGKDSVPGIRQNRSPQWPHGCVGSITHSDTWAAALVADQHQYEGLGLDMEPCLSTRDGQKLAPGILTPGECSRLEQLSPEQFAFMTTLIFSLKESLFKALYPLVGIRFYFEHAELVNWDIHTGTARMRLLCDLDCKRRAGSELEGYFCHADEHLMSLIAIAQP